MIDTLNSIGWTGALCLFLLALAVPFGFAWLLNRAYTLGKRDGVEAVEAHTRAQQLEPAQVIAEAEAILAACRRGPDDEREVSA